MWMYLIDTRQQNEVPSYAKVFVTKRTAATATLDGWKTKRCTTGYCYIPDRIPLKAGSGYKLYDTEQEAREALVGVIENRIKARESYIATLKLAAQRYEAGSTQLQQSTAEAFAEREAREQATQIALTAQLEGKGITNNDAEQDGS